MIIQREKFRCQKLIGYFYDQIRFTTIIKIRSKKIGRKMRYSFNPQNKIERSISSV